MRIKTEVHRVGTADPIASTPVTVQNWPTLTLCTAGKTDEDGLAELSCQGAPGPVRVRSERGAAMYETYSKVEQSAGAFDLENLQLRLSAGVRNGVLPYGDSFRARAGFGELILEAGAVLLNGVIATFPSPTTLTGLGNGARVAGALYTIGTTIVTLVDVADGVLPARFVPLWRYTVNSGAVVPGSLQPISTLAGPRGGKRTVMDGAHQASGFTGSVTGEASALSIPVSLDAGVTYDLLAEGSVITRTRHGAIAVDIAGTLSPYVPNPGDIQTTLVTGASRAVVGSGSPTTVTLRHQSLTGLPAWGVLSTYGGFGTTTTPLRFSTPTRVAIDPFNRWAWVCDTDNRRLVRVDSAGVGTAMITLTTQITAVATDPTGNVYFSYIHPTLNQTRLVKYGFDFLHLHYDIAPGFGNTPILDMATDGTWVWAAVAGYFYKIPAATVTGAIGWNVGPNLFSAYGIALVGSEVAVAGDGVVKRYSTSGAFLGTVDPGLVTPSSVAGFPDGRILVVDAGANQAVIFTSSWSVLETFATTAAGNDAAIGPDSVVWMTTPSTHTLQRYSQSVNAFAWDAGLLTVIAIPR